MSNQAPRAPRIHPQVPPSHPHALGGRTTNPPRRDEDTAVDKLRTELGSHNLQFGIFKQQVTSQLNTLAQHNNTLFEAHSNLVQENKTLQQANKLLRNEIARLSNEATRQRAELATLRTEVQTAAVERQEEILRAGATAQLILSQIEDLWNALTSLDQKRRGEFLEWLEGMDVDGEQWMEFWGYIIGGMSLLGKGDE
ncbi:uncharacterized protein BO72DRAFT_457758 [Aspergillus fijiensis CBS 313.89]|uniref:Autophagy-related protein 16 domain-containing protein n=1 Tax=Aspergillus fijiensis CBS 313.89 TaxID=1448319 RepID=A0A8G1VZV8_9EURO|nr:uncharacterized protein BO72DRAFT_457758 [Aspergillus fijiensis CBS 313.89]RAK78722.1 hypothetical protein BO72DRAFT_457758 [Aspergillus fijiensis CBS 313.89]